MKSKAMCDVELAAEQRTVAVEIAAERRTIVAHSASYGFDPAAERRTIVAHSASYGFDPAAERRTIVAHSASYGSGRPRISKAPAGAEEDDATKTVLFRPCRGNGAYIRNHRINRLGERCSGRLWSARTCPRFGSRRHVASLKAASCRRIPYGRSWSALASPTNPKFYALCKRHSPCRGWDVFRERDTHGWRRGLLSRAAPRLKNE